MTEKTSDVIVIGGGVIGLSIAWELAGQGVSVTVLEKGQFGNEGESHPASHRCLSPTKRRNSSTMAFAGVGNDDGRPH